MEKCKRSVICVCVLMMIMCVGFVVGHGAHLNEDDIKDTFLSKYIMSKIEGLTKYQQANVGAFIISSAPLPIFVIIVVFGIKNMKILDIMSSFAAGALIGDVFIHNLPEVFESKHHHEHEHEHEHHHHHEHGHHHEHSLIKSLINNNGLLICWGVLLLFAVEKMMSYFSKKVNNNEHIYKHDHKHEHHHHEHNHVHTSNIALSLLGDFIHNVTDGMAIGAGFNKSLKMGISLSLSIFFHEIPHEVGDFSYLLKQNMKISSALSSQLFSALGSFVGVYLSFWIGELYSNQIISFASGAFLYLALNTIMSDLKSSSSLIQIICEVFAYILGVIMLLYIM